MLCELKSCTKTIPDNVELVCIVCGDKFCSVECLKEHHRIYGTTQKEIAE